VADRSQRRGSLTGAALRAFARAAAAGAALATLGCAAREAKAPAATPLRAVDSARLRAADADPASWLMVGGNPQEQRFSRLTQIGERNVAELGLAWSYDLETARGVEATPVFADGALYVSSAWSVVHAVDAASGRRLWAYDPKVPRGHARVICCGVVNRGVALFDDKLYFGTLDGRLVALRRATGELVFEVQTTDRDKPYSITGAPRVIDGRVVIGNAGADMGARGYVSAYDSATGAQLWRTYTVPGNPADGFESEALRRAAKTWSGEWWKYGGGGTVWDGMAYDPALGLLYVGTGNGSPYTRWVRSPGGGDNLYLSSILALRPETGEIVWHYQETPAETWDYTATQPILLADLPWQGRMRKLLLHAPKNGFFFVLDRETGEFLSAKAYAPVTWAKGYDASGRPIENEVEYRTGSVFTRPGPQGAHNWQPMSFHPGTGLVYFPVMDVGFAYQAERDWKPRKLAWNTGLDAGNVLDGIDDGRGIHGYLLAWDPVNQREAWRVPHRIPWNGGTLATAGNLVFQGTAEGRFAAYRASDGEELWDAQAGTGISAAPMSFELGGVQHVAVAAGWGASFAKSGGELARMAGVRGAGRLLVYKLGGKAEPPPAPPPLPPIPAPSVRIELTPAEHRRGMSLYQTNCSTCHGALAVNGGTDVPDLRASSPEVHANFEAIVLDGAKREQGMPGFGDLFTREDLRLIQGFVLERARAAQAPAAGH
jgi:PQQ-dependent dehydrogenase (methanol/ethanol family)